MRFGIVMVALLLGCGSSESNKGDKAEGASAKPKVVDLAGVGLRFDLPAGADATEKDGTATLTQGSCSVTFRKSAAKDPREVLDEMFARQQARPGFVEKTSHALSVKGPTTEWTEKNDKGELVYGLERLTYYDKDKVYEILGTCAKQDDVTPLRITLRDKTSLLP